MKKILFSVLFLNFFISGIFADPVLSNGTNFYQKALTAFDNKDYGKALNLCEEAVITRKESVSRQIKMLEDALEPQQVQKAGKKITDIKAVLVKREEWEVLDLIKSCENKKGEAFFDNDIDNLLSYLNSIVYFPEAQKLIGDVYKIEGEYSFAESYYRDALKNSEVLDIPDERYELLYLLAELSQLQNDENARETRLLGILSEDKKFLDKNLRSSMLRTIRQDKKDSMDKFFKLYRADNYYMLKAYSNLAELYMDNGETEKALDFYSISVITGFTKVITTVQKRNINFEYKDLSSLLFEASHYDDIVSWGTENNFWKSLYSFSEVCMKDGDYIFANNLLKSLAEYCPEEYYRKAAVLLIDKTN